MRALAGALLSVLFGLIVVVATPDQGLAQEGVQEATANVHIQNRTDSRVWVYVLQGGSMVPLGLVSGMETATRPLPPTYGSAAEPVEFVADFLGSTVWFRSDPVPVDPGDEVRFTIGHDREASEVVVTE